MPQCPICKAAVWVGDRYCPTCDHYLPHPEEEDHFCPRCGIRVAPQQEICHKCKAALPEIAGTPSTASARGSRLLFGVHGIFIGTGLVIVALLLVFLFKKSPGPPQLVVTPPPQAPAEQTPAAPPMPPDRHSPIGSHGPGTRRPIRTNNPFSPESDDANTIAAHVRCQRPLPGPPGWPLHVCTPNRHPQLPRRGGTPGNLRRMGASAGRTAQYRRLVQYALSGGR